MGENVLVTGAAGFIGRHLVQYLANQGYQVHGLDRVTPRLLPECAGWYTGDLATGEGLSAAIEAAKPRFVFHLAAIVKSNSFEELFRVNVTGTRRLLDALLTSARDVVILVAGSAAEYGFVRVSELPVTEQQGLNPATFYALSKVAQGLLAWQYWFRYGLPVVRTRTFNVTGPGEPPVMVCSALAQQLAIRSSTLKVGNVESVRDFLDVRDAVRAYVEVVQKGKPGEVYNVCSGQAVKIQHLLDLLLSMVNGPIALKNISRNNPEDVPVMYGDNQKLRELSGWKPQIVLEKSLSDLLDYWRNELRHDGFPLPMEENRHILVGS